MVARWMRTTRMRADAEGRLGRPSCKAAHAKAHSDSYGARGVLASSGLDRHRFRDEAQLLNVVPRRFPTAYRHSDQPNCMNACKTGSLAEVADGGVRLDRGRRAGCYICHTVCSSKTMGVDRPHVSAYGCETYGELPVPPGVEIWPVRMLVPATEG